MKRAALFAGLSAAVSARRSGGLVLGLTAIVLASGCSKLAALAKDDAPAADAAAPTATASAATTATAAAAASTTVATTAAKSPAVAAKNAKKTLVAPSATTDRFARNRDTDGPCPAGFVEQPGVENHSSCARSCKTDATCHGHTCVDSDVGDGKVCSEIASKTPAASAAKPASKCKANEIDDGSECLKACEKDSDCPAKKTCQGIRVANPFGGTSAAQACVAP